jgi:hypothetical protein
MTRTVNQELLRYEIDKRQPLGKEKIAVATGCVPADAITKLLMKEPRIFNRSYQVALARAIEVEVSKLFPEVKPRKRSA